MKIFVPHLVHEFMLWLWWRADNNENSYLIDGERIEISIDRKVVLVDHLGEHERTTLVGDAPHTRPEAYSAVAAGMLPQQINFHVVSDELMASFGLRGRYFDMLSFKTPKTVGGHLETETAALEAYDRVYRWLTHLLDRYVHERCGDNWPETLDAMREWCA